MAAKDGGAAPLINELLENARKAIVELWEARPWLAAALDRAADRPPSADPSAFGGLPCFCPLGYSYGAHMGTLKVAQKVCRRPYASNSALF